MIIINIEQAKKDLSPQEFKSLVFQTEAFNQGVTRDVSEETLQKWMANPEANKENLQKYAMYQYISNGDIFQLFDLIRVLPNLNYKIKTLKINKSNEKHTLECRRVMKDVNHKELTRDTLSQLIASGTLVGLWVGKENPKDRISPNLLIFDDLEYFFPARRVNGKWTVWGDLSYFDKAIDIEEKVALIENLSPYITVDDYLRYKEKGEKYRYVEFPQSRSVCLRTHTLKRNQRFGIPWNTQSMFDIKHKDKLRNLEKVASNKVMNAVAVLTLGMEDDKDRSYVSLGTKLTKDVFSSVKTGLMSNKDGEASVVGLPEWAKLEYPSQKTDVLNPDKIESVNSDIKNSTGISSVLTNGQGGNYASAKVNLDTIFSRIGELLEMIESEVYNKLIKIILPSTVNEDYYLEYEKSSPLTNKEKSDILFKLHSLGYSARPLVEMIGIDFNEFIENSKYEIDTLKLRETIMPPLSSYTATGEDVGANSKDVENESSVQTKETNGNDNPKPSTS